MDTVTRALFDVRSSIYRPVHFALQELVPPDIYGEFEGIARMDRLWLLFDGRVLWTADMLRKRYGEMGCNTWHTRRGPLFRYCGWRPWACPDGARFSQHKFGRALDLHPMRVTPAEMRADIRKRPEAPEFQFIRRVEDGVPWFHFDMGEHGGENIEFIPGG